MTNTSLELIYELHNQTNIYNPISLFILNKVPFYYCFNLSPALKNDLIIEGKSIAETAGHHNNSFEPQYFANNDSLYTACSGLSRHLSSDHFDHTTLMDNLQNSDFTDELLFIAHLLADLDDK